MDDAPGIIVVDIGNSAIKLAIARRDPKGAIELTNRLQWLHGDFNSTELEHWAPQDAMHWCIASVHRSKADMIKEWLSAARPDHHSRVLSFTDLPLSIQVDAPERVGIDRLLSAVAANHRRLSGDSTITITAGTAITVNAINEQGVFLGGAILPGWPLLAKALHQYTDALPLVNDLSQVSKSIGKNTQDAIRSGLFFGLLGAVERVVAEFEKQFGRKAELFFAGGDAATLHKAIGRGILAPDLVLEGAAIVAVARIPIT